MMWRIGVAVVCLFALWTGTAGAEELLTCEMQAANLKRREFLCPLIANGNAQSLRFKVDFVGSHDDTQLSMTLTLDGAPVACGKNSKTWLNGEDGNVSLDCQLVVDGTVGAQRTLVATVNIWHAQMVAVELSAP